jgi:hypothetical protein
VGGIVRYVGCWVFGGVVRVVKWGYSECAGVCGRRICMGG